MPIYEFLCTDCNRVFNFYSSTVNTNKIPGCPRCKKRELQRIMSKFAMLSGKREETDVEDLPLNEAKMEKALQVLEREMGEVDENDPRQAASLLRKMTEAAGGSLNEGMEEALKRMEAGEDPEEIEAQMGDEIGPENIFSEKKKAKKKAAPVIYDDTLYEL